MAAVAVAFALVAAVGSSGQARGAAGFPSPPHRHLGGLDSTLAQIAEARQSGGQAAALTVAAAEQVDMTKKQLDLVVTATVGDVRQAAAAVRAAGGVVDQSRGDVISASVPPGGLERLASSGSVAEVREPARPVAGTTDEALETIGASAMQSGSVTGSPITGSGVRIAVIDLGFEDLNNVFGSTLPSWLTTSNHGCSGTYSPSTPGGLDSWGPTPHGTAVVEIVHETAPGAQIVAMCIDDAVDLWNAEQEAVSLGVRVINHSVGWYGTSRGDGTGGPFTPDAAVADAQAHGILWVNGAGNDAVDHWSAAFTGISSDPDQLAFSGDDGTDTMTVDVGSTVCVALTWDQWPVTTQDYDWGLYSTSDGALVSYSANDQAGAPGESGHAPQAPEEDNCYRNDGVHGTQFALEIFRYAAIGSDQLDLYVLGASSLEYVNPAQSVPQPASSPDAFAVGAYCWNGTVEPFSSYGPTIDGRGKPDILGPDGVSSSVYGSFSSCSNFSSGFFGTSAAAPHVAGAAALLLQQTPSIDVAGLEARLQALASTRGGVSGQDFPNGSGELWVGALATTGRVVYSTEASGGGAAAVRSFTPGYGGDVRIAAATGMDPALSPDGKQIAFSDGGSIVVADADGTTGRTTVWPGSSYSLPSWSPDGTRLVFEDGSGGLLVGNANGSGIATELTTPGLDARAPTWSPDGTTIAFVGVGPTTSDIWTIAPDGNGLSQATSLGDVVSTPVRHLVSWSPGNHYVAFVAGDDSAGYAIWTVRLNLNPPSAAALTSAALQHYSTPIWNSDTSLVFSDEWQDATQAGLYSSPFGQGTETMFRFPTTAGTAMLNPTYAYGSAAPPWANVAPVVVGVPQVGEPLEATPGGWDGPIPVTYAFQWQRCDAGGGSCTPISGATDAAYVPTNADLGQRLRVAVTATNPNGSSTLDSDVTGSTVAPATVYATTAPTVSGSAVVGSVLTATAPAWSSPTSSPTWEWLRCDSSGTLCSAIASGSSYTVTSADAGRTLRAAVYTGLLFGPHAVSVATDVVSAGSSSGGSSGGGGSGGGSGGGGGGAVPDLGVTLTSDSTTAPAVGAQLVYHILAFAHDQGATQVFVDVTLPDGYTVTQTTSDRGKGCSASGSGLVCDLDWISVGVDGHITIWGTVGKDGPQVATAHIRHFLQEANPADDTMTLTLEPPVPAAAASAGSSGGAGVASTRTFEAKALVRPRLRGIPVVGSTLRARAPRWNAKPAWVRYRWQVCKKARCKAIPRATTRKLKLRPAWTGRGVRLVATARIHGRTVRSRSTEVLVRRKR